MGGRGGVVRGRQRHGRRLRQELAGATRWSSCPPRKGEVCGGARRDASRLRTEGGSPEALVGETIDRYAACGVVNSHGVPPRRDHGDDGRAGTRPDLGCERRAHDRLVTPEVRQGAAHRKHLDLRAVGSRRPPPVLLPARPPAAAPSSTRTVRREGIQGEKHPSGLHREFEIATIP